MRARVQRLAAVGTVAALRDVVHLRRDVEEGLRPQKEARRAGGGSREPDIEAPSEPICRACPPRSPCFRPRGRSGPRRRCPRSAWISRCRSRRPETSPPGSGAAPRTRRRPGSSTATRSRAARAARAPRARAAHEEVWRTPRGPRGRGRRPRAGDEDRRRVGERVAQALDVGGVAGGQRGQLARRDRDALRQRRARSDATAAGSVVVGRLMDAVDDEAAERHPGLAQLAVEEDRLLDRVVARAR